VSKRGYWFLVVLVAGMTLGAHLVGEWVRIAVVVAIVVAGIALTAWTERFKWKFTQFLADKSPEEQDARLVWAESWADRPEILANLDRQGPRVPLRTERERFEHAPHHVTVMRWTFAGTALLVAIFAYVGVAHPPTARDEQVYLILLIVGFGASLTYLPGQIRRYGEQIEVTDAALEVVRSNGRREAMPWASIRDVRNSSFNKLLVIRSTETTVRIPHVIEGYGRLANLIATRLPPSVPWRVV
jgi:hypothetical protein